MNTNLIKKRKRNFLAMILALAIVIGTVPLASVNVFAATHSSSTDGSYGFSYVSSVWKYEYNGSHGSGIALISVGDVLVDLGYGVHGETTSILYVDDVECAPGNRYSGTVVKIEGNKIYLSTSQNTDAENGGESKTVYIDGDTNKSELPPNTVVVKDKNDVKNYKDMKVHSLDKVTEANQQFLASYYANQMGKEASAILGYGVYVRSAIPTNEVGTKKLLVWNNLSYKTPGAIYAVCYNQKDGAYLLSGTVDKNGTATFDGYILRDATSITVFAVK